MPPESSTHDGRLNKFERSPNVEDERSWSEALAHVRKNGIVIAAPGRSAHQRGTAYDLSGPDLSAIVKGVLKAEAAGSIKLIRPPLVERGNNCVHVEIESPVIDDSDFEFEFSLK